MSDVGTLFIKLVFGTASVVCEICGIVGMVRYHIKNGKDKKKKAFFYLLLILPVLLNYSMYLSGSSRRNPVSQNEVEKIAAVIEEKADEKGADYFKYPVSFSRKDTYGDGFAYVYECEVTAYANKQLSASSDSLFTQREKALPNGIKYCCSRIYSNRDSVFLHSGYNGTIEYLTPAGAHYSVSYCISRKIDLRIGFLYAPPVFGECGVSGLIKTEKATSDEKAYAAATAYAAKNCPRYNNGYYQYLQLVSEYNEDYFSGKGAGYSDTPYNKDVFPPIDEKYKDNYIITFYDNEDFSKTKNCIIVIVRTDTGEVLQAFDNKKPT